MKYDIRIWQIDGPSKTATPLNATEQAETELLLEDVLVRNPGMLMPGLTLVARQAPVDGGFLDLLGVDGDGRLVVLELKRDKLTRDAVAQVIDYCSYLESLTENELATYIVDHSGTNDIEKIGDFESWYGDRHGKELISLRPTKMVLVGLGTDARTQRMVEFLVQMGLDTLLFTFHGFQHEDKMLLREAG